MNILLLSFHFEEGLILHPERIHKNPIIPFVPSLTLRQLVSLTPERHNIELNEALYPRAINFDGNYDVVCITSLTSSVIRAYQVADEFRKREKKVVIGGYHASALPEEAKQHADSVVIGPAQFVWPKLLDDLEKGKLKPYYEQNQPDDLATLPPPDRTRIEWKGTMSAVKATNGCPVQCEFCSVSHRKFNNILRTRPLKNVIDEIKSIPQKTIFFYDPSLTTNPEYTKSLFREIIPLDKILTNCYGNVNIVASDDELLKLASEAGVIDWHVGFDSVSEKSLQSIGKKTNTVSKYKTAVKKINDYGMTIIGEFVLGFDNDKKDIFKKTIDVINDIGVNIPWLNILVPYPGTPLFDRLKREGRLLTYDWSKYTHLERNVVFQPKHMSPDELLNGAIDAYRKLSSAYSISKRIFKSTNLSFHNFLYTAKHNINDARVVFFREHFRS